MIRKLPEEASMSMASVKLTQDIKKALITYIITNKGKIDYSYDLRYTNDIVPVFLVGDKNTESDIPLMRYPVVITTNDTKYIVSNLTGSVRTDLSEGLLKSKKTDYVDFEVVRNILVAESLQDNDLSLLSTACAQLATSWLTRMISTKLRLDPIDTAKVEGALFCYFMRTYYPGIDDDLLKTKMSHNLSIAYKNNMSAIAGLVESLQSAGTVTMSEYINLASSNFDLQKIDDKMILVLISNTWYSGSDNSNIQIYTAIDNLHTMAAIMYHTLTTKVGKKTNLFRILDEGKRFNKSEQLLNTIKNKINEYTIR